LPHNLFIIHNSRLLRGTAFLCSLNVETGRRGELIELLQGRQKGTSSIKQ